MSSGEDRHNNRLRRKQNFASPKARSNTETNRSGIITTEDDVDAVRDHFPYPSTRGLVLMQIGMSLGYCAYMMTSWLYCAIQHKSLFPRCSMIWGGLNTFGSWGCIAASLLYWIFPMFCCIVFLLYMYRDLLHTRLYYEMLSHRVHLDFMNVGFFQSPAVQIMLGWMVLCLLMYPMTSALTVKGILVTLPFWIPVISFGAMLFCQWDLETRLVSVAKFVEHDVDWASKHMRESYFLRDYVAEAALRNVIARLEKQEVMPKLTMGEYIALIADEAESMHANGEEPDETLASKTVFAAWSSRYWVKLVVYSDYVVDEEAVTFRWWFSLYKAFTILLIVFFLALCFITVVTHMYQQGVIASSVLTEWVNLDILSIMPKSVPGTSQANAVAATVTAGGFKYVRDFDRMGNGILPAKSLPPHPETKPLLGSGVPARNSTQHPAQHHTPKKTAASGQTTEKRPSAPLLDPNHVTPSGLKQRDTESHKKYKPRKEKKNLIDGLLNRFPKSSR